MGAFLQGLDLQMLKKAGIVTITKKKFSIPIRGVGGHKTVIKLYIYHSINLNGREIRFVNLFN